MSEIELNELIKNVDNIKEIEREIKENNSLMCEYPSLAKSYSVINTYLKDIERAYLLRVKNCFKEVDE